MKDLKEINKILQDHDRRLAILEKSTAKLIKKLDSGAVNDAVIKAGNQKKVKIKKSLSDHIIVLRDHGTFKQPLIAEEVHKKLGAIYACDFSRVKVALLRLQKRRQLRKTWKLIKKYVAYVW